MKKLGWTARLAWGQSLILVIALAAAGIAGYRERVAAGERQALRLGLALLTELRERGGDSALAEGVFHANEQMAYLKVRKVDDRLDLAWYQSLDLADRGQCPPSQVLTGRSRWCRPLGARLVDVRLSGLPPGELLQAGLWVGGGPRQAGMVSFGELWAWFLAGGAGLALVLSLAWRQGRRWQELGRLARAAAAVIPPARRPLDQESEWGFLEQTLGSLGKELKLHKVQLARAMQALRDRRADGKRGLRLALRQKDLEDEKEKLGFSRSLAELKPPLRHLAQMSRVLEQRIGEGLPAEDQGRLHRLLRESEKALGRLLEMETELKLTTEREPAEQVNLHELVWQMGPALEAEGIQVRFVNPLPTLWLPQPRMERLFRELIRAAAGERGEQRRTTVEVGYADLHDRLAFFVKGSPGAAVKSFSETAGSWVRHALQQYRGSVWMEARPGKGGIIYFTLAKDTLSKPSVPEPETRAEAA
jgi:signal transduction histidine kinase